MTKEKKVCSEMNLDRISVLPEPILHHILSFLRTKDAISTSILSSSWRAVWTGLTCFTLDGTSIGFALKPIDKLYFDCDRDAASNAQKDSVIRETKAFYGFLYRVFGSITKLEELELCVPNFGLGLKSHLDYWLNCVVGLNVKKLQLKVNEWRGSRYMLPKIVLSCKSITNLSLSKCDMNLASLTDAQLPCLGELRLSDVNLHEGVLEGLLANCMNLRRFDFWNCHGLRKLKVLGLTKLERVQVCVVTLQDNELEAIEINAPNLLEFNYTHEGCTARWFCEIEVSRCKNMKILELSGVPFDSDELSALLENLPALETLTIVKCNYLEYLEILCQQLVSLSFVQCRRLEKVKVDTPNLQKLSLIYQNPIFFVSKSSSLKLKQAKVLLGHTFETKEGYVRLVKFLAKLGQSENLSLDVQDILIPENVRLNFRPPLCGVKQLQVDVQMPLFQNNAIEFIKSLLWLAPCTESISISYPNAPDDYYHSDSFTSHKLLKFKYDKPLKRKKSCGCWKSVYCWRHSLCEVLLETEEQDECNTYNPSLSVSEASLKDSNKNIDAILAKFFQQARIDGKAVSFVKVFKPRIEWE